MKKLIKIVEFVLPYNEKYLKFSKIKYFLKIAKQKLLINQILIKCVIKQSLDKAYDNRTFIKTAI